MRAIVMVVPTEHESAPILSQVAKNTNKMKTEFETVKDCIRALMHCLCGAEAGHTRRQPHFSAGFSSAQKMKISNGLFMSLIFFFFFHFYFSRVTLSMHECLYCVRK